MISLEKLFSNYSSPQQADGSWFKDKKILFIIVFISLLILIVALLVIFLQKKPANPESKTLPHSDLNLKYKNPSINVQTSLTNLVIPDKLPILKRSLNQSIDLNNAQLIASAFGFADETKLEISQKNYRLSEYKGLKIADWSEKDKFLVFTLSNGLFEYSSSLLEHGSNTTSTLAEKKVLEFLIQNHLLPDKYNTRVEYLKLPNLNVSNNNDFSLYKVIVSPIIENIPVISYKNSGSSIVFLLNKDLNIVKADYMYFPLTSTNEYVTIKKPEAVVGELKKLQIKPTTLNLDTNQDFVDIENTEIISLTVTQIDIVYYLDELSSTVTPTYKITGNIVTSKEEDGSVTYLIPAY